MNLYDCDAKKHILNKGRKSLTKTVIVPSRKRATKPKNSTISSSEQWGNKARNIPFSSSDFTTTLSTTVENEPRIIIALTEGSGQARCEVGMAVIDVGFPNLVLYQISDTLSYINILRKINIINPTDIIMPVTFLKDGYTTNRLAQAISKQFPGVKITPVPRKTFNKTNGLESIKKLCLPELNSLLIGLQYRYYALSAASALLLHLQNNLCLYFDAESLKVEYQESEGFAIIDISTADRLELVSCRKPAQASRYSTLFGVLNNCYTRLGTRNLRSSILQPPYHIPYIEKRFEFIGELMKKPEKLLSIQAVLQKLPNIHYLLTISTLLRQHDVENSSSKQLNYLLNLNVILDLLEPLKDILSGFKGQFFIDLKETIADEKFEEIKSKIRDMIHPAARPAQGYNGITQRCFAIKSGVNGFLDFIRDTYTNRLEEVRDYVKKLGEKYNLSLSLNNNNAKGYHIVLSLNKTQKRYIKKDDLPSEFIQIFRLAGRFTMKTMELINYSTRLDDLVMEIIKISNLMIYELLVDLKQYIGLYHNLCEHIAHLDMLQSLAQASLRESYTRPKFGKFTELKNSRHPLLDFLCLNNPPVPNPISICDKYNLQIITGPNASGKSIYIRQVMLLQIMAQVGCYVPATSAIFRPADTMFARVYLEDNMEIGASAFTLEMKEIQYLMTIMTERSLFIIDEPCRSTNLEEGTALAMAICERLAQTLAFVLVTTHYTLLTKLEDRYLNVKTWQMEIEATGDNPCDMNIDYKYKLIEGVTSIKRYGICLVRNVLPSNIMEFVYQEFENTETMEYKSNFQKIPYENRLKYKLESDLIKLKYLKKLNNSELNKKLNWYQNELEKLGIKIDSFLISEDSNFYVSNGEENYLSDQKNDDSISVVQNPFNILSHSRSMTIFDTDFREEYPNFQNNIDLEFFEDEIERSETQNVSNQFNFADLCEVHYDHSSSKSNGSLENEDDMEIDQNSRENFNFHYFQQDEQVDSFRGDPSSVQYSPPSYRDGETNGEHPVLFFNNSENPSPSRENLFNFGSFNDESMSNMNDRTSKTTSTSGFNIGNNENNNETVRNAEEILGLNNDIQRSEATTKTIPSYHIVNTSGKIKDIRGNFSVEELPSIVEDLESCSEAMIDEEDSFHTAITIASNNNKPQHIIPIVKVKEGPTYSTFKSYGSNDSLFNNENINEIHCSNEDQSISYSPLAEPERERFQQASTNSSETPKVKKFTLDPIYVRPKKLLIREINEEFRQQDIKILENSSDSSNRPKCLQQLLNRPSARQIKKTKHLAIARRNTVGVEVIEIPPEKDKKRQLFRNESNNSVNVDVSIFSDKNSLKFDRFLKSKVKSYEEFNFQVEQNIKIPNFLPENNEEKIDRIIEKYLNSSFNNSKYFN